MLRALCFASRIESRGRDMLSFKWCRLLPSCVRLSSFLRRSKALGSGRDDKSSTFHVIISHKSSGCGSVGVVGACEWPPLRPEDKEKEGSGWTRGAETDLRGGEGRCRQRASFASVADKVSVPPWCHVNETLASVSLLHERRFQTGRPSHSGERARTCGWGLKVQVSVNGDVSPLNVSSGGCKYSISSPVIGQK